MLVYVASPITENKENGKTVEENIKAASEIALELWGEGYAVICPALNTAFVDRPFNAGLDPKFFYEGDLEMIERCDAVIFTPDWNTSVGARAEMEFCKKLNVKTYVYPARPLLWRKNYESDAFEEKEKAFMGLKRGYEDMV